VLAASGEDDASVVGNRYGDKKRVTVTLDVDQLGAIRALVEARSTSSVSAFVQHAVAISLNDVAGWGALLASALDQTGGPLTRAERTWADDVLLKAPGKGRGKRGKRGKRAKARAA